MEIKFITEGMACAKCEARVVEKLSSLPGVTAVKACAADGSVVVEGDGLDRDTLAEAIEDLGFDVIEYAGCRSHAAGAQTHCTVL